MKNITPYSYSINEEIARWTFEVFLDHQSGGKWWIAFTNPTAGPWKKITSLDDNGDLQEIYRFAREEDRPDIVAVSDQLEKILIIEAKDYASKLMGSKQMKKSAQVIVDMEKVLKEIDLDIWNKRMSYEILPGFLWFAESEEKASNDVKIVTDYFTKIRSSLGKTETKQKNPINVVILKKEDGLTPMIYTGSKREDISLFKT